VTRTARDTRLAWMLMAPALLLLALVAAGPVAAAFWKSLHAHDLRLPWLGRPFAGAGNYLAAAADDRFQAALAHTLAFTAMSVALELILGLVLALALHTLTRGRGLARAVVLLPWALPTVVAALVWRFMFESPGGIVHALPGMDVDWLSHPLRAWVPIVLGDVWKTTPFVALLLLAGLQGIDPALYEAARLDGAGAWRRLLHITIPLLRPALLVALVFRALDAFRVFDLVFVLTGGGPGTSTEVVSTYAFRTLMQDLRFGYGSALAVLIFAISFVVALACVRVLGSSGSGRRN
jgi:ABC-type sugar transport system permease subunit